MAARLLLRATATPLTVRGLQHLPAGPCVLVSNHGSYLDGVILVAALPRPFVFVAKRELRQQFVAGVYLRRLGAEFVERFEARRSVVDAEHMADVVRQGRSLAVFPEGTFVDRPGLLPFHLGAFMAAANAAVPVVPVVIRGHRELLPAGRWWPRHTALAVEIHAAVAPPDAAVDLFAGAVSLRQAARRCPSRRCSSCRSANAITIPSSNGLTHRISTTVAFNSSAAAIASLSNAPKLKIATRSPRRTSTALPISSAVISLAIIAPGPVPLG